VGDVVTGQPVADVTLLPIKQVSSGGTDDLERPVSGGGVGGDRVVAVIGLGYVGLPTALALADAGYSVVGCDTSEARLAAIKSARVDLLDDDLARLGRFAGTKRLALTTEVAASASADFVIICVPTPVDDHLVPELGILRRACASAIEHARAQQTIVLTSTTYVGCTRELVVDPLEARGFRVGHDIFVAFSPERIDPGNPAHVPERTPRVVGGATESCAGRASELLRNTSASIQTVSSPEAAEMAKLLENTFRAVNISLANEFAEVARHFELDPIEIIRAAATKPYGFMPFYPGPGVGGHCIPCDPHYLLWQLRGRRTQAPLIATAMEAIARRPHVVVSRAAEVLADRSTSVSSARILVLGVTYKPNVADVRESPAVTIINELRMVGAEVAFTDPYVRQLGTAGGLVLTATSDPSRHRWDMVILHTLHHDVDYSWLDGECVLDATYMFTEASVKHIP
jgi:nucleotide sugar dehydrogenase